MQPPGSGDLFVDKWNELNVKIMREDVRDFDDAAILRFFSSSDFGAVFDAEDLFDVRQSISVANSISVSVEAALNPEYFVMTEAQDNNEDPEHNERHPSVPRYQEAADAFWNELVYIIAIGEMDRRVTYTRLGSPHRFVIGESQVPESPKYAPVQNRGPF